MVHVLLTTDVANLNQTKLNTTDQVCLKQKDLTSVRAEYIRSGVPKTTNGLNVSKGSLDKTASTCKLLLCSTGQFDKCIISVVLTSGSDR